MLRALSEAPLEALPRLGALMQADEEVCGFLSSVLRLSLRTPATPHPHKCMYDKVLIFLRHPAPGACNLTVFHALPWFWQLLAAAAGVERPRREGEAEPWSDAGVCARVSACVLSCAQALPRVRLLLSLFFLLFCAAVVFSWCHCRCCCLDLLCISWKHAWKQACCASVSITRSEVLTVRTRGG